MLRGRFSPASVRNPFVASLLWLCAFLVPHTLAHAQVTCIPVHGLSFERIDDLKLLASREGRNVAIINLSCCSYLPLRLGQFRFFSANLCDSGAEGQFHIDGKLYGVLSFQTFKQ